jgi:hypothetical protein
MDKDISAEPVNHYGHNLYNRHSKVIGTAHQVDGLFVQDRVLNRAPESTKHTDINDSCLLALETTGRASQHYAVKRML